MSALPADLGDRAVLRRLTLVDLDEIWALIELERPRLEPWMPWVDLTRTIDDQRRWLEGVVRDQGTLDGCGIFVDGRYAGGVGLRWDPFGVRGEIGYWIASAEEGRGLWTRAVRALIGVGFGDLGLHRIEIRAGVDNARSRAIHERLGFVREGIERGGERGSKGFYDLVVYSILEDEWPRSPMSGIEAVVFDLFGTLVYEFPRADWEGWLETSAAILEPTSPVKAAWQATGIERQTGRLGDLEENLRTVAARAGAWPTDAQLTEILDGRAAMYRKWFVPRPGAEEIVARLRADGYRLALISMCAPDAPAMWRASPLGGTVEVEVFSCDVGLRKPDPEIYLLAAERLGVSPQACLYVGDGSYRELSGAAAVGMRPVLIRDPQEEAEMLRPEVEAWDGASIDDLRRIPDLLEA